MGNDVSLRPNVSMWPTALPSIGVLLLVVLVLVLLHAWGLLLLLRKPWTPASRARQVFRSLASQCKRVARVVRHIVWRHLCTHGNLTCM